MQNQHIFISYARADNHITGQIADCLSNAGVAVWLDSERLNPGPAWQYEIMQKISACDCFIVLFSPSAASSYDVYDMARCSMWEWTSTDERFLHRVNRLIHSMTLEDKRRSDLFTDSVGLSIKPKLLFELLRNKSCLATTLCTLDRGSTTIDSRWVQQELASARRIIQPIFTTIIEPFKPDIPEGECVALERLHDITKYYRTLLTTYRRLDDERPSNEFACILAHKVNNTRRIPIAIRRYLKVVVSIRKSEVHVNCLKIPHVRSASEAFSASPQLQTTDLQNNDRIPAAVSCHLTNPTATFSRPLPGMPPLNRDVVSPKFAACHQQSSKQYHIHIHRGGQRVPSSHDGNADKEGNMFINRGGQERAGATLRSLQIYHQLIKQSKPEDKDNVLALGQRIKQHRYTLGLSRIQLAILLHIDVELIVALENGGGSLETAQYLAEQTDLLAHRHQQKQMVLHSVH